MQHTNITKDGTYPLNDDYRSSYSTVYVTGTFGAASVALMGAGKGGPYPILDTGGIPVPLAVGFQEVLQHGMGKVLYAVVTGSDGTTDINIEAFGVD